MSRNLDRQRVVLAPPRTPTVLTAVALALGGTAIFTLVPLSNAAGDAVGAYLEYAPWLAGSVLLALLIGTARVEGDGPVLAVHDLVVVRRIPVATVLAVHSRNGVVIETVLRPVEVQAYGSSVLGALWRSPTTREAGLRIRDHVARYRADETSGAARPTVRPRRLLVLGAPAVLLGSVGYQLLVLRPFADAWRPLFGIP